MNLKILVLEEGPSAITALQNGLKPLEAEFYPAHSSQEAENLAKAHVFDLLLLFQECVEETGNLIQTIPTIFLNSKLQNISKLSIKSSKLLDSLNEPENLDILINKIKFLLEISHQKKSLNMELENIKQAEFQAKRHTETLETKTKELRLQAVVAAENLEKPLEILEKNLKVLENAQENFNAQTKQALQDALESSQKIKSLVQSYLEFSLFSTGTDYQPLTLSTIIDAAVLELQPNLKANSAKVEVNKQSLKEKTKEFLGNEQQLSFVIRSIIDNAIHFRSKTPLEIKISAECSHGLNILAISDNGKGIAPSLYEEIFWVLKPAPSESHTGMNLALSKKIIEEHGGKIWVHSLLNQGSTFYIALPSMIQ